MHPINFGMEKYVDFDKATARNKILESRRKGLAHDGRIRIREFRGIDS